LTEIINQKEPFYFTKMYKVKENYAYRFIAHAGLFSILNRKVIEKFLKAKRKKFDINGEEMKWGRME
jgi:hypothetical protein